MELITIIFIFIVMICISSSLNILLKMRKKSDWLISLLICIGLSIIIVMFV